MSTCQPLCLTQRLRECQPELVKGISDPMIYVDLLYSKYLLLENEKEIVEEEKTRSGKVRKLLDALGRKGSRAIEVFVGGLVENEEGHLASLIQDNKMSSEALSHMKLEQGQTTPGGGERHLKHFKENLVAIASPAKRDTREPVPSHRPLQDLQMPGDTVMSGSGRRTRSPAKPSTSPATLLRSGSRKLNRISALTAKNTNPTAHVEVTLDIEKTDGENTNKGPPPKRCKLDDTSSHSARKEELTEGAIASSGTETHRAVLKECRTDFSCRLSPLAPVISELYSQGIITEFQKQDLELSAFPEYKHAMKLFDILEQNDESAFTTFCDILDKTEHKQQASILREKLHCIKAQEGADLLELEKSKKNGNGEGPPPMPSKQDDTCSLSHVVEEQVQVASTSEGSESTKSAEEKAMGIGVTMSTIATEPDAPNHVENLAITSSYSAESQIIDPPNLALSLRQCSKEVCDGLDDIPHIIAMLYGAKVLTVYQKEKVQAEKFRSAQALMLLDILDRKEDHQIETFLGFLDETKQSPLATTVRQKFSDFQHHVVEEQVQVASTSEGSESTKSAEEKAMGTDIPSGLSQRGSKKITRIKDLDLSSGKRWTIRGRVSRKSQIQDFHSSQGGEKYFKVHLSDGSAEICALVWTKYCDKFYDKFLYDKVYEISQTKVKKASQYSTTGHDFELHLQAKSIVCECYGEHHKEPVTFTKLNSLRTATSARLVDVIGIIHDVAAVTSQLLEVKLIDDSGYCVLLYLQEKNVLKFPKGAVLMIRGCRVIDWYTPRLSAPRGSTIVVNPDNIERNCLLMWNQSRELPQDFFLYGVRSESVVTLKEVKAICKGQKEETKEDFIVTASIRTLLEFVPYKACPKSGCNKKVTCDKGKYYCKICQKTWSKHSRYMRLQACLVDAGIELQVVCFGEVAEAIIRTDAETLYELVGDPDSETDSSDDEAAESTDDEGAESSDAEQTQLKTIKENACTRRFAFKIAAKWQEITKSLSFLITDVQPLN